MSLSFVEKSKVAVYAVVCLILILLLFCFSRSHCYTARHGVQPGAAATTVSVPGHDFWRSVSMLFRAGCARFFFFDGSPCKNGQRVRDV